MLFFLFLKLIKKILKAIIFFTLFLFIISSVLGFFVISDIYNLKNNEKRVFLIEGDKLYTGFKTADFEKVSYLSDDRINELKEYFRKKEYKQILADDNKIIFLNVSSINPEETIVVGDSEYNLNYILNHIKNNKKEIESTSLDDENINSYLFSELFKKISNEKEFWFVLNEYRKGIVEVYPKSLLFRIL